MSDSATMNNQLEFTSTQMSEGMRDCAVVLARFMLDRMNGEILDSERVIAIPVDEHTLVVSRISGLTVDRITEHTDLRIDREKVIGKVHGVYRNDRKAGDKLSHKNVFASLLAAAEDLGIEVNLPKSHRVIPKR